MIRGMHVGFEGLAVLAMGAGGRAVRVNSCSPRLCGSHALPFLVFLWCGMCSKRCKGGQHVALADAHAGMRVGL